MPVLRADLTGIDKTVTQGMSVTISAGNYGDMETTVANVGIDQEGKKYADVTLSQDAISSLGSVYSMTLEDTPMTLVNRARQNTHAALDQRRAWNRQGSLYLYRRYQLFEFRQFYDDRA